MAAADVIVDYAGVQHRVVRWLPPVVVSVADTHEFTISDLTDSIFPIIASIARLDESR